VVDRDGDNIAEETYTVAENLQMPSGVAFRDGSLYVAALNRILRYDDIESRLTDPPQPVVIRDNLPTETHHGWKFIGFGPDGLLYVPVGAPCNVCTQSDERFASILRMRPDGSNLEVYARGIRNSVGFDWDPESGELWFTDNGRDMLGDDRPPDELNRAPQAGMHFGFPYCHGDSIPDPEYSAQRSCDEFTAPEQALGPHVAAIGMRFYTGPMFPDEYRGQVFIAEHGSWNRSSKIGYRVTLVRIRNSRAVGYETFAEGWLRGQSAWGRPADVLVMHDGALLVSDDRSGAIYRISYAQ
jgi:glucose/arabinose dehydrogenase